MGIMPEMSKIKKNKSFNQMNKSELAKEMGYDNFKHYVALNPTYGAKISKKQLLKEIKEGKNIDDSYAKSMESIQEDIQELISKKDELGINTDEVEMTEEEAIELESQVDEILEEIQRSREEEQEIAEDRIDRLFEEL